EMGTPLLAPGQPYARHDAPAVTRPRRLREGLCAVQRAIEPDHAIGVDAFTSQLHTRIDRESVSRVGVQQLRLEQALDLLLVVGTGDGLRQRRATAQVSELRRVQGRREAVRTDCVYRARTATPLHVVDEVIDGARAPALPLVEDEPTDIQGQRIRCVPLHTRVAVPARCERARLTCVARHELDRTATAV